MRIVGEFKTLTAEWFCKGRPCNDSGSTESVWENEPP